MLTLRLVDADDMHTPIRPHERRTGARTARSELNNELKLRVPLLSWVSVVPEPCGAPKGWRKQLCEALLDAKADANQQAVDRRSKCVLALQRHRHATTKQIFIQRPYCLR